VPPQVLPIEGEGALTGIWYGAVELEAPGWYGPPIDHLTVALDDSGPRSFVFQTFGQNAFVIGDEVTTPALDNGRKLPVEVNAVSDTDFELRYAATVPAEGVAYVESLTGELRDGKLAIEYFISGALSSVSSIEGKASGLLYRVGNERPPQAALSGIWYGLVSLSAPGFAGPPVDQLTISFDAEGRPQHVRFEVFTVLPLSFGEGDHAFPFSGTRWVRPPDTSWSFDAEVLDSSFTASSFELELDILSHDDTTPLTDVRVTLAGELGELGLDVSYSMVGILQSTPIEAQAQGILVP
jgi:hypothetical protein